MEIADRKATMAHATNATLEAIGARTTDLMGLLAALALMVTVAYGAADMVSFRSHCVDCDAWLPPSQWFGGQHYCRDCELRRLERLIDEAEERHRSE